MAIVSQSLSLAGGVPTVGLIGVAMDIAVIVAALLFLTMLIAFVGFIIKSLRGDGIEWPDEDESPDGDDVTERDDGEWKYY